MGTLLPTLAGLLYWSGAYGALLFGPLTSLLCSFLGEYHYLDSVAHSVSALEPALRKLAFSLKYNGQACFHRLLGSLVLVI